MKMGRMIEKTTIKKGRKTGPQMTNETRKVRKNYNLKSHPLRKQYPPDHHALQLRLCCLFVTSGEAPRTPSQNRSQTVFRRLLAGPHQAESGTAQLITTADKRLATVPVQDSSHNG